MQTAQYSTQIFSLAVLLSCLFVYNHMGGIDESALDRWGQLPEAPLFNPTHALLGHAAGCPW